MPNDNHIEELHDKLVILAEETGHSYETVLQTAIRLCDALLHEANVLRHVIMSCEEEQLCPAGTIQLPLRWVID